MSPRAIASVLLLMGAISLAQPPSTLKMVPSAGRPITDTDREALTKGTDELRTLAAALAIRPENAHLLPDILVFHKAVDWALRHNEFMDAKHVAAARELLVEGRKRAEQLKAGNAPWTTQTGLVIRAYRSRIDDSIQPYGLVVPKDWAVGQSRARRLDIWHHGRGETMTELVFMHERMKKPGEFTPDHAFVLHPYGRFCNATKFAGEIDTFEALAHVRANYPVDPDRILLRGFSMGGASAWHLGVHHAGLWCAVNPGAGFAETANYAGVFKPGKPAVPWWEQILWRWYDADIAARNLSNVPVVAYSGENDKQKAAADRMVAAAASEGITFDHIVGPNTEHKYEPGAKKLVSSKLDELALKGRVRVPPKVRFITHTLRYHQMEWIQIDALEKHWERAEVDAEIVDEGTIRIATKNVTALTLRFDSNPLPLDKTRPTRVIIDESDLTGPAVHAPWIAPFHRTGRTWQRGEAPDASEIRKQHGLTGPIDDAFLDRFIFVRPTGTAINPEVGQWVKAEFERAVTEWRRVFRGDAIVKEDKAITPDDIAKANLVLWGDPQSNAMLARLLPQLPLQWDKAKVVLGPHTVEAAHYLPTLIHPNPANPKRYVVINSSFTFRQGSRVSNSLQTPKLPDWALIDLLIPPSDDAPGLIYDAGFFDERWRAAK